MISGIKSNTINLRCCCFLSLLEVILKALSQNILIVFFKLFFSAAGSCVLTLTGSSRLIAAKQYFMIPAVIWIIYLFSFILPGAMCSEADDYIFSSMALKFRLILIFNNSAVCCVFLECNKVKYSSNKYYHIANNHAGITSELKQKQL